MKKLQFIAMAFAGLLFASCMGDGYAEPDNLGSTIGNQEITESNVITIAQLKEDYNSLISNRKYAQIDKDIQIKGIITGNDLGGNLYNEVCLQDETGGILVCINKGALYGELPVGQQILISLKGLYIGGYGSQAELGGVYTNSTTGAQSIGKVDRYEWNKHFKIIGQADPEKAENMVEVFDKSKIKDANYLKSCAGKLMRIEKVKFSQADGKVVYALDADKDKANCVNRNLFDVEANQAISSSNMLVRTSAYAKFANATLPTDPVDITGIFTRYNNVWQILIRTQADVQKAVLSIFNESFGESQGDFKIDNIALGDGTSYVWKWASANYGMKATAYVNKVNIPCTSRLYSPAIDLSGSSKATLTFDQAINFYSDVKAECKVQVSTDGKNWEDLNIKGYPEKAGWDFVSASADLTKYCGKKTVYIGFLYTSTSDAAPTWEIKNITIK